MRLLILDQFSDPGGAQQGLLDLLPEIRARRWQALVGLAGDGAIFERVRELGFEAERLACGPYRSGPKSIADVARFLWQMPRLTGQIRRMVERTDAALIYANGPRLLPALPTGLPVVFHAHSYIGPGAVRKLVGRALRRTSAYVIANCEFVADAWRPYVPADRISVIYNGVQGPVSASAGQVGGAPTVACIGRIAPEKGQLDFVAVAAMVHRAISTARFQIIGAPLFAEAGAARYDQAVRDAAKGLPVDFPGWVGDVNTALQDIDLLLVPSAAHEATTRVILESYAAGVPVIAFRSGGIPEVIEEGFTGCLAESADEMAALAIDLLGNPCRRADMSGAARECWRRRFTLERYRRELLHSLECAAARGTATPPPAPEPPLPPASTGSPHA
jgi:glycosyltransferase involved in cell wall biosynthesis